MRDFAFFNPTRIEFGKGKEDNIGRYVNEFGLSTVLILYGSDRIKRDGLFDRLSTSLQGQGVSFAELGRVVSSPKLIHVKEAIRIVKEKKLQAVVAVGGGSVLNCAKAIAAGAKYVGDVWDFFINKAVTPAQSRNPWGRWIFWAQDNGRLESRGIIPVTSDSSGPTSSQTTITKGIGRNRSVSC